MVCSVVKENYCSCFWKGHQSKEVDRSNITGANNSRVKCQTTTMPASLQWGLDNEEKAIIKHRDEILNEENVEIKKCGLVVGPRWTWLGCSPEGIIVNKGTCIPVDCTKVKCPYSNKNMNVREAFQHGNGFYLKHTENGIKLTVNHACYYQC